jgi:hypothetical protein
MERMQSMSDLKVRIYKDGDGAPATTVTVPGGVLQIAYNLIPSRALAAMKDEGIDFDEIVRLSKKPEATGTLVEVEDHRKNERVVVSLE